MARPTQIRTVRLDLRGVDGAQPGEAQVYTELVQGSSSPGPGDGLTILIIGGALGVLGLLVWQSRQSRGR